MNRNNLALENYAERAVKMQNNILCSHSLSQYSFVDYAQIMFFFYYAPLCLYALTSYYAQNYASIIRQGLFSTQPQCNVAKSKARRQCD